MSDSPNRPVENGEHNIVGLSWDDIARWIAEQGLVLAPPRSATEAPQLNRFSKDGK